MKKLAIIIFSSILVLSGSCSTHEKTESWWAWAFLINALMQPLVTITTTPIPDDANPTDPNSPSCTGVVTISKSRTHHTDNLDEIEIKFNRDLILYVKNPCAPKTVKIKLTAKIIEDRKCCEVNHITFKILPFLQSFSIAADNHFHTKTIELTIPTGITALKLKLDTVCDIKVIVKNIEIVE